MNDLEEFGVQDRRDHVLPMTTARAVSHFRDEEMGFEAVVLADQDLAPAWQLEFQRALDPYEQDEALAMDSYCVTLPHSACAYACLSSVLVKETACTWFSWRILPKNWDLNRLS